MGCKCMEEFFAYMQWLALRQFAIKHMRDIFIFSIILMSVPFIFRRPQVGVLMWLWVSVMNPHREAYGFIYYFPLLDGIAAITLISLLINWKKLPRVNLNALIILLAVYFCWTTLTTIFAVEPLLAYDKWLSFSKNILLGAVILISMNNRTWLIALVWVLILSLAFTGIKGGIFTILTGGNFRVWGPDGSQWGANNAVTFALLMGIPLLLALRNFLDNRILKWALVVSSLLFLISVLGTQSRGGLVALCAVLAALALRSKYKVPALVMGAVILVASFTFMPESWQARMGMIVDYEGDSSATNRIVQWRYAIDIAGVRPLFGSGFDAFFHQPYINAYLFDDRSRAVHSLYFEVLGEHGYIGLIMFLVIGITAIRYAHQLRKIKCMTRDQEALRSLGFVTQYSFIAYAANGLTVNIATIDLYYYVLAILILCRDQLKKEIESPVEIENQQLIAKGDW